MSLNELEDNKSLNGLDNNITKLSKGRPRKYPIDPNTGKTTYIDPRINNKIMCPVCSRQIMECNLSQHKKTSRCKNIGEIIMLKNKIKE